MKFRSSHEAVITAFNDFNASFRAWVEGPVHAFQDEISENHGSPLHVTDVRQYEDGLDTVRIIGTPDDPGDDKAWRLGNKLDNPIMEKHRIWVPNRTNRVGRTLERKMSALYFRVPAFPGMPERWIDPVEMKMYRPTYQEYPGDVGNGVYSLDALWGDGVKDMIVNEVYWDRVDESL